jgi:hypothetical protein
MNDNGTKRIGGRAARRGAARARAGGFTLVEVMVSVAMVLMLIYGVSQVFKMSADAMGANQAVSTIVRDHRAAFATMAEDFRNCAPDSPLFLISSTVAWSRMDTTDKVDGLSLQRGVRAGFRDANEERQLAGSPQVSGDLLPPSTAARVLRADDRNPRLDRLSFFVRGMYRRYVGFKLPMATSGEAFVSFGHTAYLKDDPSKNSVYSGLAMALPENQYASERILGRAQILMKHYTTPKSATDFPLGDQPWSGDVQPPNYAVVNANLFPLRWEDGAILFGNTSDPNSYVGYGDIAPFSVEDFRQRANLAYTADPSGWFRPMEDNVASQQYTRYLCDPRELQGKKETDQTKARTVNTYAIARTSRYFLGHATQFVVEYAGDFLNQDDDGKIIGGAAGVSQVVVGGAVKTGTTDGRVDFVVDKSASATDSTMWVRRVRWYGLPRDVNADGVIGINDVVPLADVLRDPTVSPDATMANAYAPWEADLPLCKDITQGGGGLANAPGNDYARTTGSQISFKGPMKYTCAWHNDAPPMIRVLVKIDDASGRLQDGQWYEYVLTR